MKLKFHPISARRDSRRRPPVPERGVALIITLILLSVITFMAITFLVLSQRERGQVTTTTDQLIAKSAAETATERAKLELLSQMLISRNPQVYDTIVSTNFISPIGFDPTPPAGANQFTNVNYDHTIASAPLTVDQWDQNIANLFYDPRPPVIVTNWVKRTNEFRFYLDLNRNGRFDTNGLLPQIGLDGYPIVTIVGGTSVTNMGYFIGDPEWIGVLEFPDRPHSATNRFVERYAYIAVPADGTLDVNAIHNDAKQKDIARVGNDGFYRNQGVGPWEINLAGFLSDLNTNLWGTNYVYDLNLNNANRKAAFDDASHILSYRYRGSVGNLRRAMDIFRTPLPLTFDNIDMYADGPLVTGTGGEDESLLANRDRPNLSWAGADNPQHYFTMQELFDPGKTGQDFVNRLLLAGAQTNSYDRYTYYRLAEQLGTDSQPEPGKINVNYCNVDNEGNVVPGMETNMIPWIPDQFFTNAANRLLRLNTGVWARENPFDYTNTFGLQGAFGVTNIPIYAGYTFISNGLMETNNMFGYTPAVHRLLQVVANIYDSTTNRTLSGSATYPYFPSVFQPIFRRGTNVDENNIQLNDVYIVGYHEVADTAAVLPQLQSASQVDLSDPLSRRRLEPIGTPYQGEANELMVSGIPLVIGAKKGFPNFNKFALDNIVRATRKLEFHRQLRKPVSQTNQVYMFSISNRFGLQAWNSYKAAYPRPLLLISVADVSLSVTNEVGLIAGPGGIPLTNRVFMTTNMPIAANSWRGFIGPNDQSGMSFLVPGITNVPFLSKDPPYIESSGPGGSFNRTAQNFFDPPNTFRMPKLWLNTRVRIRLVLLDTSVNPNRIVDYVNLDSTEPSVNILDAMRRDGNQCDGNLPIGSNPNADCFWCTNRLGYPTGGGPDDPALPTFGILNQIAISETMPPPSDSFWRDYNSAGLPPNKEDEINKFMERLYDDGTTMTNVADLDFFAPFQPTRTFRQFVRWEANDPLVHYTISDLRDLLSSSEVDMDWPTPVSNPEGSGKDPIKRLKDENPMSDHCRPWGGNYENPAPTDPDTKFNISVKDPAVVVSDNWDFPTNKLPNDGWLGRVHRGTPWQTVYLKADDMGLTNYPTPLTNAIAWVRFYNRPETKRARDTWRKWSGNLNDNDAFYARPVEDRLLFDVFTTALDENATRGRLSINQSAARVGDPSAGLAAWSAVLSGVVVATNGDYTVMEPAAFSPAVARIVAGINRARWSTNATGQNVFPQKRFAHVGDVLAAPELTTWSPFLNTNTLPTITAGGLNDEIMERIPQQIMSLLTLSQEPRFVIYAYGQTLHPAPNSVVRASGPFFGLCTNYQVTAETATRTVVRIEGVNPTNNAPRVVVEQFNVLPPD